MAARPTIALIGLDFPTGSGLKEYLERRGCEVRVAAGGWEAEALLSATAVDVAIANLEPSTSGGLDLLRRFGGENGPLFIMLRGTGGTVENVLALELGAADIVDRSIHQRELAARVTGLLARRGRLQTDLIVLEHSTVDLRAALVMHRSGEEETLAPGQVALLRLFLANPRKVLTRDDIMAAAPAEATDAFDRSIDSRIVRLRRKLDTDSIATIRGTGYRFDPPTPQG